MFAVSGPVINSADVLDVDVIFDVIFGVDICSVILAGTTSDGFR
jgi:hypothetical protein